MKAYVDENACICCGLCEGICGEVFNTETGVAQANDNIEGYEDEVQDACDSCPVGAISIEE